ncbi:MAG: hydroxyethylthiazole kinase [Lachnospiraceae bacterium]|nr:hydroxyethylthiazole kinase [Lachnospiraceae bacterium]
MNYGTTLALVQEKKPHVQCITNFVTVNDCANIILACGGSPAMTMDIREVREGVEGMQALVLNMGAIESVGAMIVAGEHANELGIPVCLDPVACGSTALRRDVSAQLLRHIHFTAIRGNASEIRFLMTGEKSGAGVDVSAADTITDANRAAFAREAAALAARLKTVIIVSGEKDIVTDGQKIFLIANGCATMSRITGSGCMCTSMLGAFTGADRTDPLRAGISNMAVMGIAGDIAEEKRLLKGTGNATFRTDLIDAVFNMTPEMVDARIKVEEMPVRL